MARQMICQLVKCGSRIFAAGQGLLPVPSSQLGKLKCALIILITFAIVIFSVPGYQYLEAPFRNMFDGVIDPGDFNLSKNYFRTSNFTFLPRGFVVNTSKCRIPNVNIWNMEIRPFVEGGSKPRACDEEKRNGSINGLTFVKKQTIVISKRVLKKLKLKLSDISCCYQTIHRIQQNYSKYTSEADKLFRYSDECYPMTSLETTPTSGFTKVTCNSTKKGGNLTHLHTDFHLLATFQNTSRDISQKLAFWDNASNIPRPPSILLLGIDSTSRNNFRRFMPSTREVLQEIFNAVEMRGYTKVGENSFPNLVALLSSHSEEELVKICYTTKTTPQDRCPYIWSNFSAANYLTAHVEDAPRIGNFNYQKAGFIRPPVDIYPRAWMLAASGKMKCIESQRQDQILLRYLVDLVQLAEDQRLPYLITSWTTSLTHDHKARVQYLDAAMRDALLNLREMGYLQNTLLLVMSDHGYRYLSIRNTPTGWLEDKMPVLWMGLPETLKNLKPGWEPALRYNSGQLATPFNVHGALRDILEWNRTSSMSPRSLRGRSLFEKLPPRSCPESGIPVEFCPCGGVVEYQGSTGDLRQAAAAVLSKVNAELPSTNCSRLSVGRLTGAGFIDDAPKRLAIGIRTAPEDIGMEAMLSYNNSLDNWQLLYVQRTNKMRKCPLLPKDHPGSATYCQCSWFNKTVNSSAAVQALYDPHVYPFNSNFIIVIFIMIIVTCGILLIKIL